MEKRAEAKKLHLQGFSIRQIAKALGVSHTTVMRWLSSTQTKEPWVVQVYKKMSEDVRNRLRNLLSISTYEKGKTRVLSYAQIFRLLEVELSCLGIDSLHKFYRFIDYFVQKEYGSKERLELPRRSKKETAKFKTSKGKVKRTPGVVELDATGYTWKGKLYFLLLAREIYSGYFFDPYVIEAKDSSVKHYNKAINSYDIAKYLISLFEDFGLPSAIKTDNEKALTSELISNALKELGVEIIKTKLYSPSQKLIERAIRDLKDTLRHINTESFEEAVLQAIEIYNRSEHRFEHFAHPVIPSALVQSVEFRPVDPDALRFAFAERFLRTVRENTIQIQSLKYEFYYEHYPRSSDYGRKRNLPEVLCLRLIDDATKLYVYDPKTLQRLGIANLISTEVSAFEPIEIKQEKNRQRRVRRRKEKIEAELRELTKMEERHEKTTMLFDFPPEEAEKEPQQQADPFEIFLGGEA